MAYTEFCCRSGGSNLNAGTRTGNSTEPGTSAFKTYTSGSWVQGTLTFTPAGGANPTTDGIQVGDFVSIYPDAATVSPYVARIVTVGSTTFVTSTTAFSGTAPATGALVTSASIGGAWKGPNAAEAFPFGFITSALTDVAADVPRINFKNDAIYSITSGITHSSFGCTFQGYTTSYGDAGKFTLDGGSNAIILLTLSGGRNSLLDFIIQNNGTTGTNAGLALTGGRQLAQRGVVNNIRGIGVSTGGSSVVTEVEAYACNLANTAESGGFSGGAIYVRCFSHDNVGSNNNGFVESAALTAINCIADTNGKDGFRYTGNSGLILINCDAYGNGANGSDFSSIAPTYIENCNFLKNGGWGVAGAGGASTGTVINCGFGSGTQANTSGTIQISGSNILEIGTVNYASGVTPWVDPLNGDFRINLASAINAGRGAFTQTTPQTGVVTNATNASPIVITAAGRTMRTGETVTVASVGGNTAANGTFVVTNISASTFSLNGSTGNGAYTSGGTYSAVYTGTVGYPDTGAVQHLESGGGSTSYVIGS